MFSSSPDNSITSYWVGKAFRAAEKSFSRHLALGCSQVLLQGLNRQGLTQQQAVTTGHHPAWSWHLNGFTSQLRKGFTASSLEARAGPSVCKHTHTHVHKTAEGSSGLRGDRPGGCLFTRTLNNSFSSLLSPSRRDQNKRVSLAYCLELRIAERGGKYYSD